MAKNRVTECTRCGNDLDHEERANPSKDGTEVICDDCWSELFEERCTRCCELVDKREVSAKPGHLLGIWRDAPALSGELKAGYYRVLGWPFFADGMIEGHFYADRLKRVGDLDTHGANAADREQCLSGPMCSSCRRKVAAALLKRHRLEYRIALFVVLTARAQAAA